MILTSYRTFHFSNHSTFYRSMASSIFHRGGWTSSRRGTLIRSDSTRQQGASRSLSWPCFCSRRSSDWNPPRCSIGTTLPCKHVRRVDAARFLPFRCPLYLTSMLSTLPNTILRLHVQPHDALPHVPRMLGSPHTFLALFSFHSLLSPHFANSLFALFFSHRSPL